MTDNSRLQYPLESHVSLEEWHFCQTQLRPLKQNGALQPRRKQPALQRAGNEKEKQRSLSKGRGYQIQREQMLSSVGQGCCCTACQDRTPHAAPTWQVPADTGEQHSRESVTVVSCHSVLRMERQPAAQTLWDCTFTPLIIRIFSRCWLSRQ